MPDLQVRLRAMVEISEITDRESLESWLEGQLKKASLAIAHRAVMRVLPLRWDLETGPEKSSTSDLTTLKVLRACLIPGVASTSPTPEVTDEIQTAASVAAGAVHAAVQPPGLTADTSLAARVAHAATEAALATTRAATTRAMNTDADGAAALSAVAATAATTAAAAVDSWALIRSDCDLFADGQSLETTPLWHDTQNPFAEEWARVKARLSADANRSDETARGPGATDWSFWIKWYEAALNGTPLNWKMLEEIALIAPQEWEKGPLHVNNTLIRDIVSRYERPAVLVGKPSVIQKAVARNKEAIPPQIEAIVQLLEAEIEKLRGKNPADELAHEERDAQKAMLEGVLHAVKGLGDLVPEEGEPSLDDAKKMEGLLQTYVSEFRKWPRENAADMVDSSIRVTLIGLTAGLGAAFGAPALGVAVGGIAFGGKKLAGAVKSLKDSVSGGP